MNDVEAEALPGENAPASILNWAAIPVILAAAWLLYCDLFSPIYSFYQSAQAAAPPAVRLPDVLVELALPTTLRTNSTLLVQGGCEYEPRLRALNSPAVVQVTFVNSGNQTVGLYWLDFQGKRQLVKNIDPGQQHVQMTFAGHPWILTDAHAECRTIMAIAMPRQGPK